ncbi:MAG TPA: cytochrome c oxidase subunit II [Nakamurella sp.]|nr:cytochrome c oxidase subunit II [Nakamurella sp.]
MTRSRAVRRLFIAGILAVASLLLSGCSFADLPRFGWPQGITPQAQRMQYFWSSAFIAALCVGVLVWGLMFWAFIVYHKRKNGPQYPKQTKENLPLELVYTAVPFLMVGVLFYFTVTTENFVLETQPNPDVTVDVTAFKWNWDFGYPGTTVPGGGGDVHTIGTSQEVPILVLPVGKVVQYQLRSKDVIHSFWTIDFLFKRDVFPYPEQNQSKNIFQNTIEQTGAFVGRCAELCGTYHSAMTFEVRAVPEGIYQSYLDLRQKVNPATKLPYTAADALGKIQQDDPSCGQLCAPLATTTYPLDTNREAKSASEPPAGNN